MDELETMELQILRQQALSTQVTWSLYPVHGSTLLQIRENLIKAQILA